MKRISSLLIAVLAAISLPVMAQTAAPAKNLPATYGVDQRQANQQQRIDQGVKSGQLTNKEAARLEKGQDRIETMEDKAKADGTVTPKERARLHKAQDNQSRKIYREKHDRQHDVNHDGKMDRRHRK